MDAFAAYAKRANTIVSSPAPLIGPLKTRAEARTAYSALLAKLNACATAEDIGDFETANAAVLKQFAAELEYLWLGDEALRGLCKEIEWARARVDDGLDFPRWDESYSQTKDK